MADGKFLMNPGEARVRANEMTKIASELEMLLNDISRKMEEIDNVDTGVYQGDKKEIASKLLDDDRVDFATLADYSENSKLDLLVKDIIDKMVIHTKLNDEHKNQLKGNF